MRMEGAVDGEIVEGGQRDVLRAADVQFLKCFQHAEGHDAVADEDGCGPGCAVSIFRRGDLFSETVAGVVAEISFENSSLLCRDVRFTECLLIAAKTLAAGLDVERAGDDGDAAM